MVPLSVRSVIASRTVRAARGSRPDVGLSIKDDVRLMDDRLDEPGFLAHSLGVGDDAAVGVVRQIKPSQQCPTGRPNGGGKGCHDGGCGDGRNCDRGRLTPDRQADHDTDVGTASVTTSRVSTHNFVVLGLLGRQKRLGTQLLEPNVSVL